MARPDAHPLVGATVAVFVGGALGTVARAELAVALPFHEGQWPWATFLVNLVGALLLGVFAALLPPERRRFLGTGICGGLTTFSTMQLEILRMLDADDIALALAYAAVSVLAGWALIDLATRAIGRRETRA